MRNIYFLIFIFFTNACTTYTLVEKDKEVNVNSLYSIKTDMLMSKINIQGSKLTWLTNNGLGLDLFFFSQDIYQGGVLSTANKNDLKEYKKKIKMRESTASSAEASPSVMHMNHVRRSCWAASASRAV